MNDPTKECEGCGRTLYALGEHLVTREMAIDAGDRRLEGQVYEVEYERCPVCAERERIRKGVDMLAVVRDTIQHVSFVKLSDVHALIDGKETT